MKTSHKPIGAPQGDQPGSDDLLSVDRRRFLEGSGFALFFSALAGCSRAPTRHVLSRPEGEEDAVAGAARHYASVCGGCPAGCGVLVRNRDGRPIKLEGNPDHPLSRGGLCAVGQAEVLGLYDSHRLREPQNAGQPAGWRQVDRQVLAHLQQLQAGGGGGLRLLTGTIHSPTTRAAIERLLAAAPDARHVVYDPLSSSAIRQAHQTTHGTAAIPRYHFERAEVIVSLDADFLGTWLSPVEHTAGYGAGRVPQGDPPQMSYHLQIESRLSLTGCRADQRWVVRPEALGPVAAQLAARLIQLAGREQPETESGLGEPGPRAESGLGEPGPRGSEVQPEAVEELVNRLWAARGRALVVSGSQQAEVQVACNLINQLLDGYGSTLDLGQPSQQRLGDDRQLEELLAELEQGKVGILLIAGVNPVYELPIGGRLAELLQSDKAPLSVYLTQHADETAEAVRVVCPESHWLESWSDAEPVAGIASVVQPAIRPLGNSRSLLECLLAWTAGGDAATAAPSAQQAIREHWEREFYPRRSDPALGFRSFWEAALQHGSVELPGGAAPPEFKESEARLAIGAIGSASAEPGELSLLLYPKIAVQAGRTAGNPWLQELPDPVSKVTWDNYACLAPAAAARLGVAAGDLLRITADGRSLELPVLIQPGQHERVVAVALGYGGKNTARFANVGPQWLEARSTVGADGRVGVNAAGLLRLAGGALRYEQPAVTATAAGGRRPLAATQQHHSLAVPEHLATPGTELRHVVEHTTLAAYRQDSHAGAAAHHVPDGNLWSDDHPYTGHRWAMAIDLNRCTGCSACVVACQAENNVPVVGRDEVLRSREMHWIRIDRYYQQAGGELSVLHQPMLCQHCGNAPCENVCPVLATVHSEDGLNQQVYNRCVGTRYCANNCPYKVRRFNWFNYAQEGQLENAVLNPDITVRSRGVMEKCSFCVHRLREAASLARQRGEAVSDGDAQPACQQSCPAGAIVFGDLNDPDSAVARAAADPRHYHVLAELNVRPAVGYLRAVRNQESQPRETHHG